MIAIFRANVLSDIIEMKIGLPTLASYKAVVAILIVNDLIS